MVVLAALATVIASQALISGVFSLTRQAMQMGCARAAKIVRPRATRPARSTCPPPIGC
jgi:K+ transporter